MPKRVYQSKRSCFQCAYHWSFCAGGTKNSISACSNSRVRNTKLPGVISLRNDLPICAMPKGGLTRVEFSTLRKLRKMPCAVSGRRYATEDVDSAAPMLVLNIRLNA